MNNLIKNIRNSLAFGDTFQLPKNFKIDFNPLISQVYITLYQDGIKSIRWGSKRNNIQNTIERIIEKLKKNKDFCLFDISSETNCRIMFEIILLEKNCNINNLTTMNIYSKNRFEPGKTGLIYTYKNIKRYFMPTDGYTKSIMSINQLLNYLSKQCGIAKKTQSISKRIYFMRNEDISYKLIYSQAFISYEDRVLELDRGYPKEECKFTNKIIYNKTIKSINWLIKNMNSDGSFLYFYDPYKNSVVDYLHPNMKNPLYNNILRHSGGTISLIKGYELTKDKIYLEKAKESIKFFISTLKIDLYKGNFACYPFFNKKSKLGGAGIGLVAMMHYYIQTQDECFRKTIDGLVRHILSRIDNSGEMIGYYIHPKFNNGKPIINPDNNLKKELFSFYYPGEALLGLALYYLNINNIDMKLKQDIRIKSEMALDFLVDIRPIKYKYMFTTLPSDSWLMQAIEEWIKVDGLKKQSYIDFVFNDTKQMFKQMYKDNNTLAINKDYIGGFFYNYGDHVYHDASRCEGIVSAYNLAKYLGYDDKVDNIMDHMKLNVQGLIKTFHSKTSVYPHIDQKKALHSFRFKLTRQWVRVDSVQHAVCFLSRFYKANLEHINQNFIDEYEILSKLDMAGYSNVYKVKDKNDNKIYALKMIKEPRYMKLIENEEQALRLMNQISDIKYYKAKSYNDSFYFIFDYAADGNLKKYVETNGVFDEKTAERITKNILDYLYFMNDNNILHLDIKPANILLNKGKISLCDWGIAQFTPYVNSVHLKGNPIYIAPEFYKGELSIKSEIYSLGCSLFFLLTGKHIFNLKKKYPLYQKIYSHIYLKPDLSEIKSNKLRYLISKMLIKEPEKRITLDEIKNILYSKNFNKIIIPVIQKQIVNIDDEYSLYKKMALDNIQFGEDKFARFFKDTDYLLMKKWLIKASVSGYSISQNRLGYLYFKKSNYKKAFHYFGQAAYQGHDMAQYYMGILYQNGLGITKNTDIALKWFKKSAKNGYKKAYNKLDELNKEVKLNFNKKNNLDNDLLFNLESISNITGGYWTNITNEFKIDNFQHILKHIKQNDLFVVHYENWYNKNKNNEDKILDAIQKGASSIMVEKNSVIEYNIPTLKVDNTYMALRKLALYASYKSKAKRVVVTGSFGKTSFKRHLYELIKDQYITYARLNSSNRVASTYGNLASLKYNTEVIIVEIPIGTNQKTQRRAQYVKPDICVITSIGHEHIERHGDIENIIKEKCSIVSTLQKNGKVIIDSTSKYYNMIIKELEQYNDIKILTCGTTNNNNGVLLQYKFRDFEWDVTSKIENKIYKYKVPFIEYHAPLASTMELLCAKYLGSDILKCSSIYKNCTNYKSSGLFYKVKHKNKSFYIYDQSNRGGIEGYISFFKTISLIKPKKNGKKILITSEFVDYKDGEMENIDIPLFQKLIKESNIDLFYSVEKFNKHNKVLENTGIINIHGNKFEDIEVEVLNNIKDNDIVFIKAIFESRLPEFVKKIEQQKKFCRFSNSPLWDLQKNYYKDAGIDAWSKATVPFTATTNNFVANGYAQTIKMFISDVEQLNKNSLPINIIELGTGHGRFSFLLLQSLCKIFNEINIPFRYIMTDVADVSIKAWSEHIKLKPFIDKGILDFAIFDVVSQKDTKLFFSKESFENKIKNHTNVIIANFLFDVLPYDIFRVKNGNIQECLVNIDYDNNKKEIPEIIKSIDKQYIYMPINKEYYDVPKWNRLLEYYKDNLIEDTTFQFPISVLKTFDYFKSLSNSCLWLIAEEAIIDIKQFKNNKNINMNLNGGFDVRVNLHALFEYIKNKDTLFLSSDFPDERFDSYGVLTNIDKKKFNMTKDMFMQTQVLFGPRSFFRLIVSLRRNKIELTDDGLLSLFELSKYDPYLFKKFNTNLLNICKNTRGFKKEALLEAFHKALDNYYDIGESFDMEFTIGRLFFELKDYHSAMKCFLYSFSKNNSKSKTKYYLDLCNQYLKIKSQYN